MSKRESGWYRVFVGFNEPELVKWSDDCWHVADFNGEVKELIDDEVRNIDPKMVMTISGEIVYHVNDGVGDAQ